MFETYAVIGSGLSLFGIIFSYYFIRFLLRHKVETFSVTSLSDSLVTVFIGVFYIYSAIILSKNTNKPTVFNFTNSIDDIVTIYPESSFGGTFDETTTISYQIEDMDEETGNVNGESEEVTGSTDTEIENSSSNVDTTTIIQTTINPNEKEDYHEYIKDLMKQKLLNSSYLNKKIFYNNREYRSLKSRAKRDVKLEKTDDISDDRCFNETFISNALFFYSFLHCSLTLVNNVLFCKKDENKVAEQKNDVPSASKDSNSEKNESNAPIGPLFNDSDSSTETIKELFKARSTHSLHNTSNDEANANKNGTQNQKLKLITYILLMWLLPIIFIVIFYTILNSQVGSKHTGYLSTLNLSSTQASPELINIIQNPSNIAPTQESPEIISILKNVYNIVNDEVQQQNAIKRKPHYSTSIMTDIIYFLNHKYRNSKDYEENCSIQDMSLKIYFFIFIVIYVLVIIYATIKQTSVKFQNGNEKINMCILAFSFLWLPSVLELFFRVFLTQTKPNVLTDMFLTLGNTNRLFTMTADYTKSKKLINKLSVVEPVV